MRITKINNTSHYKCKDSGRLVKVDNNNNDITESALSDLTSQFFRSFLDKLISEKSPRYVKKSQDLVSSYKLVREIIQSICQDEDFDNINTSKKINNLSDILSNDKYTIEDTDITRFELLDGFIYSKKMSLFLNDGESLSTVLNDYISKDANMDSTLKKLTQVQDIIQERVNNKKRRIQKSLQNNKMLYKECEGLIGPQNKGGVLIEELISKFDNFDSIIKICQDFFFKDISLDSIEYCENQKKYCISLLNTVNDYIFNDLKLLDLQKSTEFENMMKAYYISNLRKYISHYFPVKTTRKSMFTEKNRRNILDQNYCKKYLSKAYIAKTIKAQIRNQLTQQIIAIGKFEHYSNLKNPEKHVTNFDTSFLEFVKINESFKKKILTLETNALNKFCHLADLNTNKKNDIASSEIKDETLLNKPIIKERMKNYFGIEPLCQSTDLLIIQKNIINLRNSTFHYNSNILSNILNRNQNDYKNSEYADIVIDRDLENLKENFALKIKSMNLIQFYNPDQIKSIINNLKFDLSRLNEPFVPSFKKVYSKGKNMQKSGKSSYAWYINLVDKLSKEDATRIDEKVLAHKNFLQLIYYYDFLGHIKKNEHIMFEAIDITINNNMEQNSSKLNENKFKYYEIPPRIDSESFSEYMMRYQSHLMLNDAKNNKFNISESSSNKYPDFLHDVFGYAFDKFLDDKYYEIKDIIENPNYISLGSTNTEISEKINAMTNDLIGSINVKNVIDTMSLTSGTKNFYLILKMISNHIISEFRNECIKYNQALKKRKITDPDFNQIMCLIELSKLSKPDTLSISLKDDQIKDIESFTEKKYSEYIDLFVSSDRSTPIYNEAIAQLSLSNWLKVYQEMYKNMYIIKLSDYNKWFIDKHIIGESHQIQQSLHKKIITKKYNPSENDLKQYIDSVKKIKGFDRIKNYISMKSLLSIHKLNLQLHSRLIGYINDWERDYYFFLTYFENRKMFDVQDIAVSEIFESGNITKNLSDFFIKNPNFKSKYNYKLFVIEDAITSSNIPSKANTRESKLMKIGETRNNIAHFRKLTTIDSGDSLLDYLNVLRYMFEYDRKKKNSITKSFKTIFENNNMDLILHINDKHLFEIKGIYSKKVYHLQFINEKNIKKYKRDLSVDIHDSDYLKLCRKLIEYNG